MLPDKWDAHKGGKYLTYNGRDNCLVRLEALPQGFLWQHRKQYGFESTLQKAKDWVEAAADFWPRKL